MRGGASSPVGQSLILACVCAAVMLPNLGVPSLWDVDEGVNAEAAREMREIDTWIVPTFNFDLRTAKPALLYWLQRISYDLFGVSEWAARFPAVLCGLGSVLTTAALARRMFGPAAGLLAGLILVTSIEFVKLSHAATPDAPLIFFVGLTYYLFWIGHEHGGRRWFLLAPIPCGLAVLTKGPAYIGLIGLAVLLYFLWNRDGKRLLDRRLLWGFLILFAVAGPWYVTVAVETRGAWIKAFLGVDNVGRFREAMEGHDGRPLYSAYYFAAIAIFFAPWSSLLYGTFRLAVAESRSRPVRLLLCWFGVIFVVTSVMATKLPNYIATLYPALAILTARLLTLWRQGDQPAIPKWVLPVSAVLTGVTGVGVFVGFLILGGAIPVAGVRTYPGLAPYSALGLTLTLGGIGMGYFLRTGDRGGVLASLVAAATLFVGLMAAFAAPAFDRYKAPRELVAMSGTRNPERDIRLACYRYTQPSLTFYAERRVERLVSAEAVADFLAVERPSYVFVAKSVWEEIRSTVTVPVEIVGERFCLIANQNVLVVANRHAAMP